MNNRHGSTIRIFSAALLAAFTFSLSAAPPRPPFQPGETLQYKLKWGILPAGRVRMRVEEPTQVDGKDVYHLTLHAKTSGLIAKVFNIRTKFESFVERDLTKSLLFRKERTDDETEKNWEIVFDWENNKGIPKSVKPRPVVELAPNTLDLLGVLYAARARDLKVGDQIEMPVTDGRKLIPGVAHVIAKERIKTDAGKFDTVRIVPDLENAGGVFDKSDDASLQVWFSTDKRRLPVRASSKLFVGHLTCELVKITPGRKALASTAQLSK